MDDTKICEIKEFNDWWENSPYRIGFLMASNGNEPGDGDMNMLKIAFSAGFKIGLGRKIE